MSWAKFKGRFRCASSDQEAPPEWTAAAESSHTYGLYNEADADDFEEAARFCANHPQEVPRLLPSGDVDRINIEGCRAWGLKPPRSPRFRGHVQNCGESGNSGVVKVSTRRECSDVCLVGDLPLMAGLYAIQGKQGVYYEVVIRKMDGIIAIGTACRPYPDWRFPGWNRLSAGLHLDDMRKFYEDPEGGRDYTPLLTRISSGDTIGCGYDFSATSIFFTYNGQRLPDAFAGVYVPRMQHDVYAAIGVEGACEFEVNFGGDKFRWQEGNEWTWRVEGHVGCLSSETGTRTEELPSYE